MPPAGEADAEEVWAEMRQEAETQAMEAAERLSGGAPEKPRRSLLDRLLGRRA
jgi:hypothetical protein